MSCLESFDHDFKDLHFDILRGILLPKRGRLTHRNGQGQCKGEVERHGQEQ